MRLILVSQEYPPETAHGGIATQTHLKAHGLAALGHRVTVLSHSVDGRRSVRMDGDVEVTRIPGPDANSEAERWRSYSEAVADELRWLTSTAEIDIIDCPEYCAEPYAYLRDRTRSSPRVLVHVQGPLAMLAETIGWPERDSELFRVGTEMESYCLRNADAVYASGDFSLDRCRRAYGLALDDAPTIHMGVDTRRFSPDPARRRSDPTIVSVGRIAASKGSTLLVEAACRVARSVPRLTLALYGRVDDAFRVHLESLAAEDGSPDLIEWHGEVDRDRLPGALASGHVFASPSFTEGGPGFVFLEAMACGVPVIGCSGSGIEETVDPDTGILVPPGDLEALTEGLQRLLLDPELGARLGTRARTAVVSRWETSACAARLESFYRSILEETAPPVPALVDDEN